MARPKLDQPRFRLIDRNGTYYVRWWQAGAWHRVSTGTSDRRQAERYLAQHATAYSEPVRPKILTLADILDGYLIDKKGRVSSHETLRYACDALKRHLGDLIIEDLTVRRSRTYAEQRRREGHQVGTPGNKRHKPTSNGTITRELVTLRAALRWAVEHNWIERDPKVEVPKATPPRGRWLERDEAQRLLDNCMMPHVKLFVALGLYTAARSRAILELTWDRVNLVRGVIEFGEGTGNKGRSAVPIPDALRPYLLEARSGATCANVIEHAGKPVGSIKTGFLAACRRAGIKDATPHTLRHTAATWMSLGGRPMSDIAKFLGDSEKIVEKVYAKYSPDYLREAAKALSGPVNTST